MATDIVIRSAETKTRRIRVLLSDAVRTFANDRTITSKVKFANGYICVLLKTVRPSISDTWHPELSSKHTTKIWYLPINTHMGSLLVNDGEFAALASTLRELKSEFVAAGSPGAKNIQRIVL